MPIAELNGITKDYLHPVTGFPTRVLDDISFVIPEKETIAITGPSGSGKTTLLNILGTLDKPTSGKVVLNGTAVNGLEETGIAHLCNRFIGFVFQQHLLLPQLNLIENVLLPVMPVKDERLRKEAKSRALELIEKSGLKDHIHHFPSNLSVGECQRTAVIRALINLPSLLLADEPTGSLDAGNAMNITTLLTDLHKEFGFSLVVVTHDPDVAKQLNIHYRLSNGKLHKVP
jgi:lipoprotein-releasing system ATP-binding protein